MCVNTELIVWLLIYLIHIQIFPERCMPSGFFIRSII